MSAKETAQEATASRLSRADWIEFALEAIARDGAAAMSVERLARDLGVTKGSFYWHFRDRADLLESVLRAWEEDSRRILDEASTSAEGSAAIGRALELVAPRIGRTRGRLPDQHVFAWSQHDEEVAARVARVEQERIEWLVEALRAFGLDHEIARRRAIVGYLCLTGWLEREWRAPDLIPGFDELVRELLVFFETGRIS